MEHESDGDTNFNRRVRYSNQRIVTGTGGFRNSRTRGNYPYYSIGEIGQNTKSPEDLRKLVVSQTPEENHLLTLV